MAKKTAKASTSESAELRPVLVTTAHRGVFYGRLAAGQTGHEPSLTLEGCRCAIRWVTGGKGFLSLAAEGPGKDSRIGATAPSVLLHNITSVSECTPTAAARWEGWP